MVTSGIAPRKHSVQLFETAALIREVEQRLLQLFAQGKLFGTVHTCIGQEFVGIAIAEALEPADQIFSNHRCHGHFLARTGNVDGLIAEVMGRETGVCGGRGGSQHLCDVAQGFFSNGIQGGIMPVASGLALSLKLRQEGSIAVVFIGDGTLGEGTVYETLNLASKWQLPLLIVLENNGYAQSTPQSQNLAGDIEARAAAFGIRTERGSTWEPEALVKLARNAVGEVRQTGSPLFLIVDTYRLMAHSKSDDNREAAEVESYWRKDPLKKFVEENPDEAGPFQASAKNRVDEAVSKALQSPYASAPSSSREWDAFGKVTWSASGPIESERAVAIIREALRRNMARDPRIFLFGEDIESPYGGAFKVTHGLSDDFPERVRNTPISEATIVGMANGLALGNLLPVCEIMFGDFLALAADQLINHASKFRFMYNEQVRVPLVVRTPMGGRRGYGPTHSQSLEKHFLGLPDTLVLALHERFDPGKVYDRLFASIDGPTILIENKLLYATRLGTPAPEGFSLENSDERYPTTRMRPRYQPDVTVVCYGGMVPHAEAAMIAAFEEEEILAEMICPIQLYPFNAWPVLESVQQTRKLLVVEEGHSFAAFGAELIAQIQERNPGLLTRCKRLASPNHPIPSCGPLELSVLPGAASIKKAIKDLVRNG
ncbi:MAG TPA: thiamine pyrophosphate-dependent enzyme [Candidatus Sulfotelmatobacter sp.]|nr:thiamine pyrophosphate-dependent enzyme [Candidatus Sulfotelmatobacter sp.]